jgi:hypothetical protein
MKASALAMACCLLTLLCASPALAWNNKGHMVVAYVAYKKLDPAVRARADALLRLNPFFTRWLTMIPASVPPADRNLAIFMIAATWPDQIKRADLAPDYHDDGTHDGNVPNGPSSSQNTGFADKLRHKYWHFVDIPFATPPSLPLPPVIAPNAQERITLFLSVLKSTAADPLKSYDLAWVLHIIGDVHQPLHSAARITSGDLDGDDGGNGVKITCAPPCQMTRLHSVWDGLLGGQDDVQAAMNTAKSLPPADATRATILDEASWINEGFELAKSVVYVSPVGPGSGPFTLSQAYNDTARTTGRAQAALAGARLAGVLNRDLK